SSVNVDIPDYAVQINTAAENSRVGIIGLPTNDACDPEISTAFDAFMARVEQSFRVAEVAYPDLSICYAMGDVISKVEAATLHSHWMRERPMDYSQAVYSRTEPGFHIPA